MTRADIGEAFDSFFEHLVRPGAFFTAAQRLSIAQQARSTYGNDITYDPEVDTFSDDCA